MTDDQFRELCNTYGFAPSRALREMLDKAMEQEREACADEADYWIGFDKTASQACVEIADAIRARSNT